MSITRLAWAVLALTWSSWAAADPIVYQVHRSIGSGRVDGTLTTDGTLGNWADANHFIGFDLEVSNAADPGAPSVRLFEGSAVLTYNFQVGPPGSGAYENGVFATANGLLQFPTENAMGELRIAPIDAPDPPIFAWRLEVTIPCPGFCTSILLESIYVGGLWFPSPLHYDINPIGVVPEPSTVLLWVLSCVAVAGSRSGLFSWALPGSNRGPMD